jgi:sugar-specific transcriptional regulator TrmB
MVNKGALQVLQRAGLNEKEALVYGAALKEGEAPASQIAKVAGLKRPTTYVILNQLVERGLMATQTSARAELFRASNPMLLLERHRATTSLLDSALPELLSLSKNYSGQPRVETFYGPEGIEHGWSMCLQATEDILYFADEHLTASVGSPSPDIQRKIAALTPDEVRFQSAFVQERIKRKVWVRGIIPWYSEAELETRQHLRPLQQEFLFLKNKGAEELREFIFVPRDIFPSQAEVTTFNDTVLTISYQDMVTCVYSHPGLAASIRAIFNLCRLAAKNFEPPEVRREG